MSGDAKQKVSYQGSCECKRVKYSLAQEPKSMVNCHCTMCQKMHGAAFATWAPVAQGNLTFTASDTLKEYKSSNWASRTFCGVCGSNITMKYSAEKDGIWVTPGTFDFTPASVPSRHIYVADKAAWFKITDHLSQRTR